MWRAGKRSERAGEASNVESDLTWPDEALPLPVLQPHYESTHAGHACAAVMQDESSAASLVNWSAPVLLRHFSSFVR